MLTTQTKMIGSSIESFMPTANELDALVRKPIDSNLKTSATIALAGRKVCPTRHGCTGATSCDSSYGDYSY